MSPPAASAAAGGWATLAPQRLRAGDPQEGEMASKLLEIAIGSDERGLIESSQGGGEAIYVWDFVHRFQFSCLENLGNINGNDSDGKL